jgi:hypothetical protein
LEIKIAEYLDAGVPLVWIVTPGPRTIRAYRADGTTRLFRAGDVIENELGLPGVPARRRRRVPRPAARVGVTGWTADAAGRCCTADAPGCRTGVTGGSETGCA